MTNIALKIRLIFILGDLVMYKFGVYKISQLGKGGKTFFGKFKNVSITLYDKITKSKNSSELAERVLLLFSDSRGAYKRTYQKRFEVFDSQVISFIKKKFKKNKDFKVLDIGISDGRTALDFYGKLKSELPNIEYLATDYSPQVFVISRNRLTLAISPDNSILEILYPPFVFNLKKPDSIFYPINRMICFFIQRFLVPNLVKQYLEGKIKAKEILLFAPDVLKLASTDERFKLDKLDVIKPISAKYDALRAMNVLNVSYFTKEELNQIIANIFYALSEGGVFITGSNQNAGSTVHGGVFLKRKNSFERVINSGNGSVINDLITKFHS